MRSSKASEGGLSSSGGSIASGLWRAVSMSGGDGAVSVTARSSSAGGGTPTPGEERQQQGASEPGEQTEPLALAAEVSRAGSALLRADSTRRKSRSVRFTEESQSSGGGAASSAFDQQQQQQQQVNLDNMRWHNIWAGSSVAGDVGGAVTAAAAQANGAAHGAALPPSRGPRSGPALIGRLEPQSSDPSEPLSELSDEGGAEELLAVQPGEVSFHLIANGSGGSNVTAGRSSSLSPRHACRAPQTADVTADEVLSAGDSTPTGGGRPTLEFRLSNFFLSTSKNAAADDAANGRVQLPPAAVAAAHANSSRDGRPARESNGSSIEDGRGSGFVSQRVTREQTESVADEEHAFIAGYRSRSRSSDAVGSTISSEHTARSGSTGAGTEHTDSQSGSAYTWYSSEGARGPQQQQGQRPALPLLDGVGRTDSGTCDTSGAYNAFTYRHGRPLSQSVLSAGSAGGGVTTSQAPRQQTPAAGTVLFGSSQDENAAHASEGVAAASSEEPQDIVTQIFSGLNHSFVATATAGGSNAAAGSGLDATRVADAAYGRDNRASSIFDLTRRQQLTTSERYAQLASKRLLFKELASRRLPSLVSQLATLVKRGLLQAARSFWPVRVVDTLLLLAAGLVVGGIQGTHWTVDDVPGNAAMAMVVLAVLATATHMRTFSTGGHMFRRESAAGVRTLAYFGSHALVDMMWVALSPALFLAPYYYLTLPRAAFAHHYAVALGVCFWASGAAYLCSVVAPRQTAFAAGVFVVLVAGAFINGLSPSVASARGGVLEYVLGLSFNRWAMELLSIYELVEHQDTMRNSVLMVAKSVGLCGVDQRLYDDNDEALSAREAVSFLRTQDSFAGDHCARYRTYGYAALFLTGLLTRLATLAALELTGWRTQRRAAAGTGAAKG